MFYNCSICMEDNNSSFQSLCRSLNQQSPELFPQFVALSVTLVNIQNHFCFDLEKFSYPRRSTLDILSISLVCGSNNTAQQRRLNVKLQVPRFTPPFAIDLI